MITFTPPIKASLLVTAIYVVCFQFFLYSGHMMWMLPANIFFIGCCMKYVSFLSGKKGRYINMLTLIQKGMGWSFITAAICFASAVILLYLYSSSPFAPQHSLSFVNNMESTLMLLFCNGFIANFVSGSLAVFLIAGIKNERSYSPHSQYLPSVKDRNR